MEFRSGRPRGARVPSGLSAGIIQDEVAIRLEFRPTAFSDATGIAAPENAAHHSILETLHHQVAVGLEKEAAILRMQDLPRSHRELAR